MIVIAAAFLAQALSLPVQSFEAMNKVMPEPGISQEQEIEQCLVRRKGNWYAEAKTGYYQFVNSTLREIFGSGGGANVGAEVGYHSHDIPVGFWANGFYFHASGNAISNGPSVSMDLGTIAFGAKAFYDPLSFLELSAGAGPRFFIPRIQNHSPYVAHIDNRTGVGGAFMGAVRFHSFSSCPWLLLNVFFDFSLWEYDPHSNTTSSLIFDTNFNFWNLGIGFGGEF